MIEELQLEFGLRDACYSPHNKCFYFVGSSKFENCIVSYQLTEEKKLKFLQNSPFSLSDVEKFFLLSYSDLDIVTKKLDYEEQDKVNSNPKRRKQKK